MEQLVASLTGGAIFFAIVYAFAKAAVAPIHAKLDRILALQDLLLKSKDPSSSVDATR